MTRSGTRAITPTRSTTKSVSIELNSREYSDKSELVSVAITDC